MGARQQGELRGKVLGVAVATRELLLDLLGYPGDTQNFDLLEPRMSHITN